MTGIDIMILAFIVIGAVYGGVSGLIKILIFLGGVILGFIFGYYLPKSLGLAYPVNIIIGICIFFVFWIIFGFLAHILGKIGKIVPFNSFLGFLLGLFAGCLISFSIIFLIYKYAPNLHPALENSIIGKYFLEIIKRFTEKTKEVACLKHIIKGEGFYFSLFLF